jgi:hypothetical protein
VEEGDEGAEGEGGEGAPGPEGGGAPGGGEHAEEDDEEPAGPKWDDGSGDTPEWMQQRAFLADVQLESYVRPLPFITVPIMRSKGFKDNTTELEEGGVFKFAVRVAPMIVKDDEDEDEDDDDEEEEKAKKKKATPLMETKRMKQKRLLEENARKQAKFIVDDEQWTTPDEQWQALRRLIGGGGAALAPQEVQVRAYVVRGKNIRPIDPNGLCDPYIKANLAGTSKSYGARKDHVKETLAPWFYKTITFTTELPGPGRLRLEVYDWDKRGGDDLVGRNVIDLEDRWFNAAWNAEYQKRPPLELRPLMNPAAVGNQGNVEVILEMFDAADDPPPALRLAPPNVYDVELRVTVFKARNMVCKDAGQNDLFFKIGVVGVDHKQTRFGETQTTDTHFFATDGKGSFNYRLIYRFTIPALKAKLRVSAYDYDLIGSNDNIGEATIPLVGMCKDLIKRINRSPDGETGDTCLVTVDKKDQPQESKSLSDRSVNFLSSYLDGATEGLWVPLYHPSKDDLVQGEVELRLDLPQREEGGAETRGERPGTAQPRPGAGTADASHPQPVRPVRLARHHPRAGDAQEGADHRAVPPVPLPRREPRRVHHQRRRRELHQHRHLAGGHALGRGGGGGKHTRRAALPVTGKESSERRGAKRARARLLRGDGDGVFERGRECVSHTPRGARARAYVRVEIIREKKSVLAKISRAAPPRSRRTLVQSTAYYSSKARRND